MQVHNGGNCALQVVCLNSLIHCDLHGNGSVLLKVGLHSQSDGGSCYKTTLKELFILLSSNMRLNMKFIKFFVLWGLIFKLLFFWALWAFLVSCCPLTPSDLWPFLLVQREQEHMPFIHQPLEQTRSSEMERKGGKECLLPAVFFKPDYFTSCLSICPCSLHGLSGNAKSVCGSLDVGSDSIHTKSVLSALNKVTL